MTRKNKRHNWDEIIPVLGTKSDYEIGRIFDIHHGYVSVKRNKLGIEQYDRYKNVYQYFGKKTDEEIADIVGGTKNAVTQYRIRHSIKAAGNKKERDFQNLFCSQLSEDHRQYVKTANGTIDVLTNTHIYEVKLILTRYGFYCGVGQLMIYAIDYPEHNLVIYCKEMAKFNHTCIEIAAKVGVEIIVHNMTNV